MPAQGFPELRDKKVDLAKLRSVQVSSKATPTRGSK